MKEINYICDQCDKKIKTEFGYLTISSLISDASLEMHFCGNDCMKIYLTKKWQEMDLK